MRVPRFVCRLFASPGRIALLLGLGAISTAGAKSAPTPPPDPNALRLPQHSVADFGEMRIWSDAGQIYVQEEGGTASELRLNDTMAARELKRLLGDASATDPQVLRHRIILVGGGGASGPLGSADRPAPPSTGDDTSAKSPAASREQPESTGKSGASTSPPARKG